MYDDNSLLAAAAFDGYPQWPIDTRTPPLPFPESWQSPQFSMPTRHMSAVREEMERLSARDVANCLMECAPATAAQVLNADAWSWKAEALEHMSGTFKAAVLRCMKRRSARLAPTARQVLCERLCLRASHTRARHANVVSSSWSYRARFGSDDAA